jgi:hypothetical protein
MAATIKREEGSTRSMDDKESEHSQTNVDSTYTNNAIQLDISKIKEEREVMCIDSEGLDVHTTTTTVNIMNRDRDPEQPDMEVRSTYEIADFLSMCPSALTSDPQEDTRPHCVTNSVTLLSGKRPHTATGIHMHSVDYGLSVVHPNSNLAPEHNQRGLHRAPSHYLFRSAQTHQGF